ncbi:MAG: tetratricopeptide repeat protein [bacterium]|nr:tetratricopeptide repeat protein [bacterium]
MFAALIAAIVPVWLCLSSITARAEPLPAHSPFHFSSINNSNGTLTTGQGCIVSTRGISIVPVSMLEEADHATVVLPGGKAIPIEEVEAVDEASGLARIRLGRAAPGSAGKLSVKPAPAEGQGITVITVGSDGSTVRTQCTVKSIREIPYLSGFYHLEASQALPPPGGGIYAEDGALVAVVIRGADGQGAGVVVSTKVIVRVVGMRSSKESLGQWSSGHPARWSKGPVSRYVEAQTEIWSGRHGRAIELLEPAIGSAGTMDGAVAALLGESYLAMNLLPETIVALKSAIENGAVTCRIYQHLAWAYMETGQYDEAKKFSEKVITEQGEKPMGYLLLARLSNLRGDHEKAVYEARRALKRQSDCQCAHFERGIAYLSQGRFESAIESLRMATALDPTDADALRFLGYAYLRNGSLSEAFDALRAALELNPEMADAWKDLGEACSRANRGEEALEAYRQAICADPEDQGAYYRLASECMRQGHYQEAILILDQGLGSCGDSAWLTYQIGKAYCCAGQVAEARHQVKRLSTMNTALAEQLHRYIEISAEGDGG